MVILSEVFNPLPLLLLDLRKEQFGLVSSFIGVDFRCCSSPLVYVESRNSRGVSNCGAVVVVNVLCANGRGSRRRVAECVTSLLDSSIPSPSPPLLVSSVATVGSIVG